MAYTAEESIAKFGTPKYAGWNEPEASGDFQATGQKTQPGISGQYQQSPQEIAQEYAQSIVDAQKKEIERETKWIEQYTSDNPFVFDEALARESATAEYEPYYTEVLQDYLGRMDLKRESLQSDVDLLKSMQEYDTGARTRAYNMAVAGAEEGYAGSGMFFSGIKQRGLGQREVEYQAESDIQGQKYDRQFGGYESQKKLYDLEEAERRRDIERQQQESVESGVLTREKEARTQYNVPFEQSYYRQFPTGTGNTLKGYTVPEYYRY